MAKPQQPKPAAAGPSPVEAHGTHSRPESRPDARRASPKPPHSAAEPRRFGFQFDVRFLPAAFAFGITPVTAWVEVADDQLEARFGWWRVHTPLQNIDHAHETGPYAWWKVIGPAHMSLVDRGLTFATNADRGVCLSFREQVTGIAPLGIGHRGLTVTVADPEGLIEELRNRGVGERGWRTL